MKVQALRTGSALARRASRGGSGASADGGKIAEQKPAPSRGNFFVSSEIHLHAEQPAEDGFVPGNAHYSYVLARNKFLDMFRACGFGFQILRRPEIYFSEVSRRDLQFAPDNAPHLIFKPFEHVRLLKGARNIGCIAWEFDRLLTAETAKDKLLPTEDYVWIASRLDEIWTPCRFTRDTFARHGIEHCHVVPAPIAEETHRTRELPSVLLSNLVLSGGRYNPRSLRRPLHLRLPEIVAGHYSGARPKIFLSVLNPCDWRKNIGALIRCFLAFNQLRSDSMLILKFVADPELGGLENVLDHHVRNRIPDFDYAFSDAVWVSDEFLPLATYRQLLACADFYFCTSYCEGQNLPMLEAMSCGAVPVSVHHTAMADYLEAGNAVLIPSRPDSVGVEKSAAGRIHGARWFTSADADIVGGLLAAYDLPETALRPLSAAARQTVAARYGYAAVAQTVGDRLAELCGPR